MSAHNVRIIGLIAVMLYSGCPCTDLSSHFKFYTDWCSSSGTLCTRLNPEWASQNCFAMCLFPIIFIQAVYSESTFDYLSDHTVSFWKVRVNQT